MRTRTVLTTTLLSSEFASLLTGRYNPFNAFTLTYSEYIGFTEEHLDAETEELPRFLGTGSSPPVWRNRYDESDTVSKMAENPADSPSFSMMFCSSGFSRTMLPMSAANLSSAMSMSMAIWLTSAARPICTE